MTSKNVGESGREVGSSPMASGGTALPHIFSRRQPGVSLPARMASPRGESSTALGKLLGPWGGGTKGGWGEVQDDLQAKYGTPGSGF